MKQSTNILSATLKTIFIKVAFCIQLIMISISLPMLYYVSISYNEAGKKTYPDYKMTNKGKKIINISSVNNKLDNKTASFM